MKYLGKFLNYVVKGNTMIELSKKGHFLPITICSLIISYSTSVAADCYFNVSPYWAVTEVFPADNSMSHEAYIELEDQNGRPVDGSVINNTLYRFNDEHPTERVKQTDNICRMAIPDIDGMQGFFHITPFNPNPEFFDNLLYVRFECDWSKTCAIDE